MNKLNVTPLQYRILILLPLHSNELFGVDQRPLASLHKRRLVTIDKNLNFRLTKAGRRAIDSYNAMPKERKNKTAPLFAKSGIVLA